MEKLINCLIPDRTAIYLKRFHFPIKWSRSEFIEFCTPRSRRYFQIIDISNPVTNISEFKFETLTILEHTRPQAGAIDPFWDQELRTDSGDVFSETAYWKK